MFLSPPGMFLNEMLDITQSPGSTEEVCTRKQGDRTTKSFAAFTSAETTVNHGRPLIPRAIEIPQHVVVILKEAHLSASHGTAQGTTESACAKRDLRRIAIV